MNITNIIWPEKYEQERITVEFDFGPALAPGDSVTGAQILIATVKGVDATPDALRYGGSLIKGARVFQQVHAGTGGCAYRIEARASTKNNNLLVLARVLPVVAL